MTAREWLIAEAVRRAGEPTPEVLSRLRGLLPPVLPEKETAPTR